MRRKSIHTTSKFWWRNSYPFTTYLRYRGTGVEIPRRHTDCDTQLRRRAPSAATRVAVRAQWLRQRAPGVEDSERRERRGGDEEAVNDADEECRRVALASVRKAREALVRRDHEERLAEPRQPGVGGERATGGGAGGRLRVSG